MLEKTYEYYIKHNHIHGVEINLSCPNIKGKSQVGYDFDSMLNYLTKIFKLVYRFELIQKK